MLTAFRRPEVRPIPSPDRYYSPDRIRHHLGHWHCCIAGGLMPGTCSNDPFNNESKRGTPHEGTEFEVSCIKGDLNRAWHRLTGLSERLVSSYVDIGPYERLDGPVTRHNRRLDWFHGNRHRFGNLPPETLIHIADDATCSMAFELGFRPCDDVEMSDRDRKYMEKLRR